MSGSEERDLRDDVTALRMLLTETTAERDQLQARIDAYEGHLEAWEEMAELISQSSLGTPEAAAIRERTPPGVGRAIVRVTEYLARAEEAEAERDRLRAVVDAVRELRTHYDQHQLLDTDPDAAVAAATQAAIVWETVTARLDDLEATDG